MTSLLVVRVWDMLHCCWAVVPVWGEAGDPLRYYAERLGFEVLEWIVWMTELNEREKADVLLYVGQQFGCDVSAPFGVEG